MSVSARRPLSLSSVGNNGLGLSQVGNNGLGFAWLNRGFREMGQSFWFGRIENPASAPKSNETGFSGSISLQ